MDEELYRQNILEHYKEPHNKRIILDATMEGKGKNANCGDLITFYLKVDGDVVTDVSFVGVGCAVSQAAASMLTDKVKGKTINELKAIAPGDVYNMLGVQISPGRVDCALLGYKAMSQALLGSQAANL
ncbi:MAG: SUF system NifU family Fe-S cluster assembly protein [Candidatus Paceibacterota bacterium]|jgi:nitrogen fixation NifU-like protein